MSFLELVVTWLVMSLVLGVITVAAHLGRHLPDPEPEGTEPW